MLVSLILLVATLVPMLFLSRWLSRHIQGLGLLLGGNLDVALIIYFVIMLPGIFLHEVSHWLMAKLLGLRTGGISIGPSKSSGGKVRLGYVQVAKSDFVRESLVGVAPLLTGSLLILLIGTAVFDLRALSQALILRDAGWFLQLVGESVRVADFWIWLYLIFAISNSMLPSESDRRAWLPLAIFLAAVAILLAVVGWVPQVPDATADRVVGAIEYLDTAFLVTLAIDLLFMGLFAGLERGLTALTGNRITYRPQGHGRRR